MSVSPGHQKEPLILITRRAGFSSVRPGLRLLTPYSYYGICMTQVHDVFGHAYSIDLPCVVLQNLLKTVVMEPKETAVTAPGRLW